MLCPLPYVGGHFFLGSSMVEHAAVNRKVVGSSPTRGAPPTSFEGSAFFIFSDFISEKGSYTN